MWKKGADGQQMRGADGQRRGADGQRRRGADDRSPLLDDAADCQLELVHGTYHDLVNLYI